MRFEVGVESRAEQEDETFAVLPRVETRAGGLVEMRSARGWGGLLAAQSSELAPAAQIHSTSHIAQLHPVAPCCTCCALLRPVAPSCTHACHSLPMEKTAGSSAGEKCREESI
jgi:hypothetical protein